MASRASLSAGKRVSSGASKVSVPSRTRSSRSVGALMRPGQASATAIGVRMSGGAICASTEPSLYLTRQCTMDCGMDDDARAGRMIDRKQMIGLDQLQALVHQRRAVDGDLVAHRPVRVLERLLGCGLLPAAPGSRCGTGRPTPSVRSSRSMSGSAPASTWKAAECSLSTGTSSAPVRATAAREYAAGRDQAFLVGERDAPPVARAAKVGSSPAAPTMAAITQSAGSLAASTQGLFARCRPDAGAGQRGLQAPHSGSRRR